MVQLPAKIIAFKVLYEARCYSNGIKIDTFTNA